MYFGYVNKKFEAEKAKILAKFEEIKKNSIMKYTVLHVSSSKIS